jgi:hypothetical protein
MSEHIAHILYRVLLLAFEMAEDEPALKKCGADNKPVTDLLPEALRDDLATVYRNRRAYLRETTP